ncbi:phosphoenolpyruvate-dependent sugar phosphotransferase system EIIA 2 [Planctopirus limnophila DSM 3776]|uniref:Phosphoenolpyruvate-dependent sugar phosphotransferase system EIIA 2 n=1 Tax=Planctopirus limnophila (strain ATCC 43296 / DSM 3776 / IFAM 1008 / Mu 290) TaxID=521674 RepID=D5SP77_PLAL2|nr:PTS sugar transporter subunit IIA [Planctopirus limnophila]ADG68221.1 phosphoenolpyruvate-dependent sugar phosphotransferase system EIIA 2 [Planctopirus limnophila DSM 3776]
MSRDWYSLDELARHLGRDRREIEKLVNRGRIPGRKVAGDWQFHPTEITHWLEQEMREYTDRELAIIEQSHRTVEHATASPIAVLLSRETIQVPLEARTKRSVLESMLEVAGRTWQIWQPAALLAAIQERESVLSTAFDMGVAIPHPRNPVPDALGQSLIAMGRTPSGIPFGAPNRGLTDIFFLVLCRDSRTHLHVLARLGRLLQKPGFVDELRLAPDSDTSYDLICRADAELTAG